MNAQKMLAQISVSVTTSLQLITHVRQYVPNADFAWTLNAKKVLAQLSVLVTFLPPHANMFALNVASVRMQSVQKKNVLTSVAVIHPQHPHL